MNVGRVTVRTLGSTGWNSAEVNGVDICGGEWGERWVERGGSLRE